jgi:hypothetical protein
LNPAISPAAEAAVMRALTPAPESRFRSVADLHRALAVARQAVSGAQAAAVPTQVVGASGYFDPSPAAQVQPAPPVGLGVNSAGSTVVANGESGYAGGFPAVGFPPGGYPAAGEDEPPAESGAFDRRWLIPLALLFVAFCLGVGVLGGYGLYTYVLNPAAASSPAASATVGAIAAVATTPATGLLASPTLAVGGLPSLTPFATNTVAPGPTSASFSSPTPGLETRSPAVTATPRPTWHPCEGAAPSRLYVGDTAYVSFDPPTPNRVRQQPNTSAEVIGVIQPGEKVELIGGPMCSNQWNWWQVRSLTSGLTGWTVEGDRSGYWLVPLDRPD